MALKITDENLNGLLLDNDIVVMDFWAAWCGPCRVLGPIIDKLALANPDIKIGKVDVDSNPTSSMKYEIRGIPTVVFVKNGEIVDRVSGVQTQSALQQRIDKLKN